MDYIPNNYNDLPTSVSEVIERYKVVDDKLVTVRRTILERETISELDTVIPKLEATIDKATSEKSAIEAFIAELPVE